MPENGIAIILLLAVAFTALAMVRSAAARAKHKIMAPATTGHPEFERAFRVHLNTVESMVLFVPLLWAASTLYNPMFAFWAGVVWLVGRVLYMFGYMAEPEKRGPGAIITLLSLAALFVLAVLGLAGL
jgi:glutathione S-transferase